MKKKILTIIIILVMLWVSLIGVDYYRASKNEKPVIVLKEKKYEYSDGIVTTYTSLGYKYIKYERTSKIGYQFGGFWIQVIEDWYKRTIEFSIVF